MIKALDIVRTTYMSRVERNEAIYRENEAVSEKRGILAAGRLLNAIGVIIMVIVVAACLSLVIPRIAGYDTYVVVSGSMEPAIPVGSIVYSEEVDPALLLPGDVIVFVDESRGPTPITHRVVVNNTDTQTIITKGDANQHRDVNPVTYDNVVGRVKAHVPRVGFTAAMFTSTLGKLVAALLLLEAWLLTEIGRRLIKKAGRETKSIS